ncbi:putative thymidylate synthase [Pseudomonas phage fnug]|uniref:thymidylate synthase n=2 Tax=Viruses TaxID=10239 RepID=A0A6H2A9J1_9CAUD|nr:putative thymidylate synthase [Pseudomonas phage fnug]WAX23452.1 thymidylate synthase [Pseudomonas phage pPA-N1803-4At.2]
MEQYLNSIRLVKEHGVHKGDRTGTGTQSMFGQQERYSLRNNRLPVVTTKKIHLASVIHELFWMLSGDTKVDYLIANGVRIWNEWVKPETAVYEPMTDEAVLKAVTALIGAPFVMYLHCMNDDSTPFIETVAEFESGMTPETIQAFWDEYPVNREEIQYIIGVSVTSWNRFATEGFDEAKNPEGIRAEYNKRLYRALMHKEPERLVGGDLGAVYGKTWRNLEDTRVIPKYEWFDYEKRGFDFVADIPGTTMETDRCVVTRRIDQIQDIIDQLRTNPDSRRIIVCAWAPHLIDEQALPPCHAFIQFWTRELTVDERVQALDQTQFEADAYHDKISGEITRGQPPFDSAEQVKALLRVCRGYEKATDEAVVEWLDQHGVPKRALSCQLYQRSCDTFLGKPFNITFYSLLTHMLANQMNMIAEEFIWTGGDVHIYSNHQEQTDLQLTREPKVLPTIRFKEEAIGKDIREIGVDDFVIENYEYHPHIAGKVAV